MNIHARLSAATTLCVILCLTAAQADDKGNGIKPPPISDSEAKALVARIKTTWRAQDGETADEITAKAAQVAYFFPRTWDVVQTADGGGKSVVLSWARQSKDKEGDEFEISWDINPDGSLTLGPSYAKTMELGWQAFALSLIQSEVTDDYKDPNKRFLHDLSNLNFVDTRQGRLGDLLAKGGCSLRDPVFVQYTGTLGRDTPKKGDFWHIQLSVDCKTVGPRYFTHDGVILFMKPGPGAWRPFSFFSHRIATYPPGSWFIVSDPVEQQAFALVAGASKKWGMTWGADDIERMTKVMELLNDGSMIHW
jgi:hypothetical protein